MRTRTAAGGLLIAGTASTAIRTIFPRPFFFLEPRRDQETYQPDKTSLPPSGGGLYKRNQGEFWCSILAGLHGAYAPARFGVRGARCFVGRFSFGRRMLPEAGAHFGRWMTWTIIFSERENKRFLRTAVDRCSLKSQANTGSRLSPTT